MKEEIEDWKVTAFATGDLAGAEREAIEQALLADPALSARVEAVRRQADLLTHAFTLEALPVPSPRPNARPRARGPALVHLPLGRLASAAAALLLAAWYAFAPDLAMPHSAPHAADYRVPRPLAAPLPLREEPSLVLRDDWDARGLSLAPVSLASISVAPIPRTDQRMEEIIDGAEDTFGVGVRRTLLPEEADPSWGASQEWVVKGYERTEPSDPTLVRTSETWRIEAGHGEDYCKDMEGPEVGSVTTTDLRGHAGGITISGGIDVPSTWRASGLESVLNRGTQPGNSTDGDVFRSPVTELRFDGYFASHVSGTIALAGGREWESSDDDIKSFAGLRSTTPSPVEFPSAEEWRRVIARQPRGFDGSNYTDSITLGATGGTFTNNGSTSTGSIVGVTSNSGPVGPACRPPAPPGVVDQDAMIVATVESTASAVNVGTLSITGTVVNNAAIIQAQPPAQGAYESSGVEGYAHIQESAFLRAADEPLSTFAIDVDTASYANVRRFLHLGKLPPPDAVRIEELVNYFPYDYEPPKDGRPFAVHVEAAACPWNRAHRLLRIGLKGREVAKRPPSNLVFLLDVSGSMEPYNKLPLIQAAMRLLVHELTAEDHVSIVTYAGEAGVALESTPGDRKKQILAAIAGLHASGGTNGGAGIELAYQIAQQHLLQGGTNRVILATDGDWNVGVTNQDELVRLIEEKSKSGVSLSVLGVGMGNLKDDTMEKLADHGHGNYAYLDSLSEARKVLVEQIAGTLCTIAKDVKVQVEFNPAQVAGYRLLGYEDRALAKEDFKDDRKRAGDIGAAHTVTALYEVIPAGQDIPGAAPPVGPLKYQVIAAAACAETCTVKLRYKEPNAEQSTPFDVPFEDKGASFDAATPEFRFAASVAGYGMLLRRSQYAKGYTWAALTEIASGCLGDDPEGYRQEFLDLVRAASDLSPRESVSPSPGTVTNGTTNDLIANSAAGKDALGLEPTIGGNGGLTMGGIVALTTFNAFMVRENLRGTDLLLTRVTDVGAAIYSVSVNPSEGVGDNDAVFANVLPRELILQDAVGNGCRNLRAFFLITSSLNNRAVAEPGVYSWQMFYLSPDVYHPRELWSWRLGAK